MPTENHYIVKTQSFEGPLELLLELIEKRKLFINEVSLSEVTNDYITYVKQLEKYNFALVTSFLIVAATLILIKSKSLLPTGELTEDETNAIGDLELRLELYKIFKEAGVVIQNIFGKKIIFGTQKVQNFTPIFTPDKKITGGVCQSIIDDILQSIPEDTALHEVTVRKVMSIEEMMKNLTDKIQNMGTMSFTHISKHENPESYKEAKIYTIVSFLAMLELVRNGFIDVLQNEKFSDMSIKKID